MTERRRSIRVGQTDPCESSVHDEISSSSLESLLIDQSARSRSTRRATDLLTEVSIRSGSRRGADLLGDFSATAGHRLNRQINDNPSDEPASHYSEYNRRPRLTSRFRLLLCASMVFVLVAKLASIFTSPPGHGDSQRPELVRGSSDYLKQGSVLCRMVRVDVQYGEGANAAELERDRTACVPIIDGKETGHIVELELPALIAQRHKVEMEEGRLLVNVSPAVVLEDEIALTRRSSFDVVHNAPQSIRHLQTRRFEGTGIKSVTMVRISTSDSTPSDTPDDMAKTFGQSGVTVATQYNRCSFGQLAWQLSSYGVIDVRVDQPVADFESPGALIAAAQKEIEKSWGVAAQDLSDKVLMCLPPGTGDWAGSSSINSWRSQFNDGWCTSLSAVAHELGHLMGLLHANRDGVRHADATGYMTRSRKGLEAPQRCFNGVHHYQLGWYRPRHRSVEISNGPQLIELAAFVDYDKCADNHVVIATVGERLYLQYNRAKSFNVDTGENADQVTITEDSETGSDKKAGLSSGDRFAIQNFDDSGKTLVIEACSAKQGSDSSPDVMIVSVGMEMSLCPVTR